MKTNDSMILWKTRIENCKKSGLKVPDWCTQNDLSRYAYYYWHRKIIEMEIPKTETSHIFAEVTKAKPTNCMNNETDVPEINITWKDVSITINDQSVIPLVAKLLNSLEHSSC